MTRTRTALIVCVLVALLAASSRADSKVTASSLATSRHNPDWRKAASSAAASSRPSLREDDASVDLLAAGSGAGKAATDDDTAAGFGPDDEDTEIGSGSPPRGMVGSSGDQENEEHDDDEDEPIDYDDYPKTDWIEADETTVHSATGGTQFTTMQTVPSYLYETGSVERNAYGTVTPRPEDHDLQPMGKTPAEADIWPTMTMVPMEPFTPAVMMTTTTTTLSGGDGSSAATTTVAGGPETTNIFGSRKQDRFNSLWRPGILAAVIGGSVLGLLAAVLLITFVVYRVRKKDEGSYALDDDSKTPPAYPYAYHKTPTREFYA